MGPSLGHWEGFLEEETPDRSLEVGVGRLARLREGREEEVLQVEGITPAVFWRTRLDTGLELGRMEHKLTWREKSDGVERPGDGAPTDRAWEGSP